MDVNVYEQKNVQPEVNCGTKLSIFIKTKPVIFGLIIAGIVIVVALVIILPIVLLEKDDEKEEETVSQIDLFAGLPKLSDIVTIGNEKVIDFTDIKTNADTKYTSINSKSQESGISYNSFCTYLGGLTYTNEKEKVYLTYKWVIDNIAYDYDNYIHNTLTNVVYTPSEVFTKKTTVCSGYARLFTALLQCMGYEATKIKNIMGHSKGAGYDPETVIKDTDTDHEWNAVQIEDKWCLIDTTWGAGSVSSSGFQKSNSDYYLCTPPEQFVRSHLPQEREKNLQFLDNPINLDTFQKMISAKKNFFEYGFTGVAFDKQVQNICGRGRLILKYDESISPLITYHLVDESANKIDDYITKKKVGNNYYYIDFYINEEGEYDIDLYGKVDPSEASYWSFLSILIKCDSSSDEKHSFPYFYDDYKDNLELISPMYKTLESGKKYNFKILATGYDELFLYMYTSMDDTGYDTISMDKDGDYFIKNDVVVYKNNLYIKIKDTNTGINKNLISYNIISN